MAGIRREEAPILAQDAAGGPVDLLAVEVLHHGTRLLCDQGACGVLRAAQAVGGVVQALGDRPGDVLIAARQPTELDGVVDEVEPDHSAFF